VLPIPHF